MVRFVEYAIEKVTYLRCSNEWGFLGFHMPPNIPRFLNILTSYF